MYILGLSCYYHDSAAVLIKDGEIIAAAQEERFTRVKHDPSFPTQAIRFCLSEAGIDLKKISYISYYDKPFITFERLLETYIATAPRGLRSFVTAMPTWLKEKLNLKWLLKRQLREIEPGLKTHELPPLLFSRHHLSHAASAFYPSPYENAAVLCLDGVGEWATTSVWTGAGKDLVPEWEIRFPHSLGLLYSAFTYFAGFKVNSGEYKLMGLAPYGEPTYVNLIRDHLIDIKEDGTFRLNMDYFGFATGLKMTNKKFNSLFGGPERAKDSLLTLREMDIAKSIQVVTEEIILKLARTIRKETKQKYLCLAGGVALNCVANGELARQRIFDGLWVQPAAGDAGGALGAALCVWHQHLGRERKVDKKDKMKGSYLGPHFDSSAIQKFLDQQNAKYVRLGDQDLIAEVARLLAEGHIIGWHQGRMEFGPRALGNRSILGDPRNPLMQATMNLKIKFRESFRPFAPAVLADKSSEIFSINESNPYMMIVGHVAEAWRKPVAEAEKPQRGLDLLKVQRSRVPAITHVDYSARVQSVYRETNPLFYDLIKAFEQRTNTPLLVNTSFNVRGEPIVCDPKEAYNCFMGTDIDYLVLGSFLLEKSAQPGKTEDFVQVYGDD
ncbi:MAG: carbamoyltransferase [Bdellovibrionales bacterium]|nr:carbamoyltransferase [Bdellovibrionales bacterium]